MDKPERVILKIRVASRASIRKQLICKFLEELPGTGKKEKASKYIYRVEKFVNGKTIFLKRPAGLNKGMDFTVHVEGQKFRSRGLVDAPSHLDIIKDLKKKKKAHPRLYSKIANLIKEVYECKEVKPSTCYVIKINAGTMSVAEVVMAIKWLFIEQDVTYWNWSGRGMLYAELQSQKLC